MAHQRVSQSYGNRKPHHIEAAELGVVNYNLLKRYFKIGLPAKALREMWDYRAAGLTVDQARDYISSWSRSSYHRWRRGERQISTMAPGRIICMMQVATRNLEAYDAGLKKLMQLTDKPLAWDNTRCRWDIAGRTIITVREEDVTWDNSRRRNHWPSSTSVSYTSYLIRLDRPGTVEAYKKINQYDILSSAAEAKTTHSLRGNWRQAVLNALLPGNTYIQPPQIGYKSVAVIDNQYVSIYDGTPYALGVTLEQPARRNHEGGYYYYSTPEEAQSADVPSSAKHKDVDRAILKCEVGGKRIAYDNGKRAASWIRPIQVMG